MKALFLYTEAAPYVLACLQRLAEGHGVEVHLVRWPVNSEAPFELAVDDGIRVHERGSMDDAALLALCEMLRPDVVFVSGWIDKGYLKVCRRLRRQGTRVVLCSDTAWRGDARQWLAVGVARLLFPKLFTHAWVTGEKQRTYARKLGFGMACIRTGFYSADTERFLHLGTRLLSARSTQWPHRFLCVARYIPTKNHAMLCEAFAALCDAHEAGDWELWIAGTGELFEQVAASTTGSHARIRHLGFVQADAMPAVVEQCGVFVLPSAYEPWGVVVHEHACAGLPLLLSDAVGAAERFLEDGLNGRRFKANDKYELMAALRSMVRATDAELLAMGGASHRSGTQWGPGPWAATAIELSTADHG